MTGFGSLRFGGVCGLQVFAAACWGIVSQHGTVQDTDSLPPSGWLCGPFCTQRVRDRLRACVRAGR